MISYRDAMRLGAKLALNRGQLGLLVALLDADNGATRAEMASIAGVSALRSFDVVLCALNRKLAGVARVVACQPDGRAHRYGAVKGKLGAIPIHHYEISPPSARDLLLRIAAGQEQAQERAA